MLLFLLSLFFKTGNFHVKVSSKAKDNNIYIRNCTHRALMQPKPPNGFQYVQNTQD